MRKIQHGEVEVAVAGGSEAAITPLCLAGFKRARVLARADSEPGDACRPFDADRSGFVMAEGAGAVILEESTMRNAEAARSSQNSRIWPGI